MLTELRWKICGMRDPENIREVAQLQPDYMGFIFYKDSPRYVGNNFRIPEISGATKRVGVFVNTPMEEIMEKVRDNQLDFVQLHGAEPPQLCMDLKAEGVGVIKVFSVGDDIDFRAMGKYRKAVDYFLFDTRGKYYGGNAQTFNWSVLSRYDMGIPFFLSGGITPGHIERIRQLNLPCLQIIDVNSGVEIRPGFKDVEKIKAMKVLLNSNQKKT